MGVGLALLWGPLMCHATRSHSNTGDYTIDVWQVEDGLPQVSVTSIKQTPDGYLWLGTFNGLARFDGVRFTVFDEGNTPALGSSRIVRLDLDRAGGLWTVTEDGALARLYEGRFTQFTAHDGVPPAGAAAVIVGPQDRRLLVDREGGVHCLDGKTWVRDPGFGLLHGNRVSLFADANETLWIWFREKRHLGRMMDGEPKLLRQPGQLQDVQVRAFGASRAGGLWLVIADRIWHYQPQEEKWRLTAWELPESVGAFTYLLEDRSGNLWLSSYGQGLLRFGPAATPEHFTTGEGLSHNTVRALWEDREGSIWVGTDGGGLNRLKRRKVAMYDHRQGLTANVVMSIAQDPQDPDALWLGINGGGVNRLRDGRITSLVVDPLLRTNSFVYGVFGDRRGGLWIGSYDQGILRYGDGILTRMTTGENWAGRPLLAGLEDQAGTIWLAGSFGVVQWREGRFTNLNAPLGWSNVMVRALAEDRAGNVFVGSFGQGLGRYRQGQWKLHSEQDGLADNHIAALWVDGEDTLWIGTVNGGLCRLRHGRFATVDSDDGLPSNTIGALVEGDEGHLWLGSNRGLIRLSRHELNEYMDGRRGTLNSRVFSGSDGLSSSESGGGAQRGCCKTADGKLWFATANGLAAVDPDRLEENSLPPPVVIEAVTLDDSSLVGNQRSEFSRQQPVTEVAIRKSGALVIPPDRHRLEIRFTGLSLVAPEKVRFRYRLVGLDQKWVEAGSQRTASYAHIPPGEYRFEVTACNNDGVWSDTGAALAMTVLPRFWQTIWFQTLALVGLLAGTAWLVRLASARRMQRQLAYLEQQNLVEKERARIAQDIHDDLGSRLTEIGLLSERARRCGSGTDDLQRYLTRISDRTRDTVGAMDEIVWAVDPAKDTIEGLLNYLAPLGQELFQETPTQCRLDLPVVLSPRPLSAKVRHGLLLAAKEALHNCLKHSNATEVWIRASLDGRRLELQIEDNGCGFVHDDRFPRDGHGLTNMRRRLADLGGKCRVHSQPGQGTKVLLRIDVGENG